jgi:hypothetical protein
MKTADVPAPALQRRAFNIQHSAMPGLPPGAVVFVGDAGRTPSRTTEVKWRTRQEVHRSGRKGRDRTKLYQLLEAFARPSSDRVRQVQRDGRAFAAARRRSEARRPDGPRHGRAPARHGPDQARARRRVGREGPGGGGCGRRRRRRRRDGREDPGWVGSTSTPSSPRPT